VAGGKWPVMSRNGNKAKGSRLKAKGRSEKIFFFALTSAFCLQP
jgi:hypothetical protein